MSEKEQAPVRLGDTSHDPVAKAKLEGMANEQLVPEDYYGHKVKVPWLRVKKLTAEQMGDILAAVVNGQSIRTAAADHGTTLWSIQRQRLADEAFGKAMNQALELRTLMLEDKAFELAFHGEIETMQKGEIVFERRSYPTAALLQFLLKAYNPEKYGVDRKEIKAGPLESAPEQIRGDTDRERLLERLNERREAREQEAQEAREAREQEAIEASAVVLDEADEMSEDFSDLA